MVFLGRTCCGMRSKSGAELLSEVRALPVPSHEARVKETTKLLAPE